MADRVVGLDPLTGGLLWSYEMPGSKWPITIATPVVEGDLLFVTTGHVGAALLRLRTDRPAVDEVWRGNAQKTIASMPSLGLLTLAAVTPEGFDIAYLEHPEFDPATLPPFDLVAVNSFTAKADVMNVVFGHVLDRLNLRSGTKQAVSWTLLASSAALPLALAAEALWAPLRSLHLPGVPAAAFTLAVGLLAVGACRTDFGGHPSLCCAELNPGAGRTLDADGAFRGGSGARRGLGGGALAGALFEMKPDKARERDE